jgi:CBS domain-containing protein
MSCFVEGDGKQSIHRGYRRIQKMDARDIMTQPVVCARPYHTIAEVARILSDHRLGAVPVCDDTGLVVGMVSEGDLLRPFWYENGLGRSWWLEVLAEGEDLAEALLDYMAADDRHARDVMSAPVITATEDTTAQQLAGVLVQNGIKRVPILRDDKLVGIISRGNLVAALAAQASRAGEVVHDQLPPPAPAFH